MELNFTDLKDLVKKDPTGDGLNALIFQPELEDSDLGRDRAILIVYQVNKNGYSSRVELLKTHTTITETKDKQKLYLANLPLSRERIDEFIKYLPTTTALFLKPVVYIGNDNYMSYKIIPKFGDAIVDINTLSITNWDLQPSPPANA